MQAIVLISTWLRKGSISNKQFQQQRRRSNNSNKNNYCLFKMEKSARLADSLDVFKTTPWNTQLSQRLWQRRPIKLEVKLLFPIFSSSGEAPYISMQSEDILPILYRTRDRSVDVLWDVDEICSCIFRFANLNIKTLLWCQARNWTSKNSPYFIDSSSVLFVRIPTTTKQDSSISSQRLISHQLKNTHTATLTCFRSF